MPRERLTYRELQLFYSDPRSFASEHNGLRISLMDEIGVPQGWVIEGRLSLEIWNNIKTIAIPMAIRMGRLSTEEEVVKQSFQAVRDKYGRDAFYLIFRDDESESGWISIPVLPADLEKDAETLVLEGLGAKEDGDDFLDEMKRAAFIVSSGE